MANVEKQIVKAHASAAKAFVKVTKEFGNLSDLVNTLASGGAKFVASTEKKTKQSAADTTEAPKKRGRKPKNAAPVEAPKKRGRKAKAA